MEEKVFLTNYQCADIFEKAKISGLSWDTLEEIYNDYKQHYYDLYLNISNSCVENIKKDIPSKFKIIYGRPKNPEHLVEKIIRKIGKENSKKYTGINVSNYRNIITDLVGIRILILKREDWKVIHDYIIGSFSDVLTEATAYVCYGDRDIYKNEIRTKYTNKGYRSQHYLISYKDVPIEIQVRTLSEEVYGEFDHLVRYPYRESNKFLIRYSHLVSKAVSELDDLISTCCSMPKDEWDRMDDIFVEDIYRDWAAEAIQAGEKDVKYSQDVSAGSVVKDKIILRKG